MFKEISLVICKCNQTLFKNPLKLLQGCTLKIRFVIWIQMSKETDVSLTDCYFNELNNNYWNSSEPQSCLSGKQKPCSWAPKP